MPKQPRKCKPVIQWAQIDKNGRFMRWDDGTILLTRKKGEMLYEDHENILVEIRPTSKRRKR